MLARLVGWPALVLLTQLLLDPAAPQSVHARSTRPAPLGPHALAYPQQPAVRIVRRNEASPAAATDPLGAQSGSGSNGRTKRSESSPSHPNWDDRFLLSFFGHDRQRIRLALRPSANLVPSNGVRSVHRWRDEATGEWKSSEEVLTREAVKVYEGWVLRDGDDVDHWVREEEAGVVRPVDAGAGWARIVVSGARTPDARDSSLRFQGTYSIDGELYTIHPTERYLHTRDPLDPTPPSVPVRRKRSARNNSSLAIDSGYPAMVITRDFDTLSPEEHAQALARRGLPDLRSSEPEPSCAHDQLAFNTDPNHPVFVNSHPIPNATTPWFPFSPFAATAFEDTFSPADHSASSPRHAYVPRGHRLHRRQGNDIGGSSGQSSNFINSIGSTVGCPKQQRVVFMGVAADCTYMQAFSSADAAREQILTDFGSVSALYQRSFNVSLGIVELVVMNSSCPSTSAQVDKGSAWNVPCQSSSNSSSSSSAGSSFGVSLNDRLSLFSQWRGDKGGGDGAGLWHLLTSCQTGSEVGVAWLGQLCRVDASGSKGSVSSGTGVTATTRNEWQVIAHEIGHNFGAIHDCDSTCSLSGSCCPLSTSSCNANANYIMSPVSRKQVSDFSPCSIGNICTTLSSSLNTTCLADQGASGNPKLISLQSCGNGILEDGEECDPGQNANDPCCDASTCKFAKGAVCDPRNSLCCTSQCQMASKGTVCRAAVDSKCDIAEVCSGNSFSCPSDQYQSDGTSCGSGLSCASGICTSRDLQCQNAGSSLGLKSACSGSTSSSCSITCQDPSSSRSCLVLDQSFRDGTSCGYGGRCSGGMCAQGSNLERAKGWYRDHLNIAIPVTVVVGLIVIALIVWILTCCFCRRRRTRTRPSKAQAYSAAYMNPTGNGGYYPSQPPMRGGYGGQGVAYPQAAYRPY